MILSNQNVFKKSDLSHSDWHKILDLAHFYYSLFLQTEAILHAYKDVRYELFIIFPQNAPLKDLNYPFVLVWTCYGDAEDLAAKYEFFQ